MQTKILLKVEMNVTQIYQIKEEVVTLMKIK